MNGTCEAQRHNAETIPFDQNRWLSKRSWTIFQNLYQATQAAPVVLEYATGSLNVTLKPGLRSMKNAACSPGRLHRYGTSPNPGFVASIRPVIASILFKFLCINDDNAPKLRCSPTVGPNSTPPICGCDDSRKNVKFALQFRVKIA